VPVQIGGFSASLGSVPAGHAAAISLSLDPASLGWEAQLAPTKPVAGCCSYTLSADMASEAGGGRP
jgi:hypothetical protein